ncbi:MAG: PH domain-containing protein [Actinomycetota bacterium]
MIGLAVPAMLDGAVPAFVIAGAFAVMLIAVLATQPWWSRVHRDGVTRRCPLRTQHIPWAEIDAFDRLRRGGGLVIRLANGRHAVICDRTEGHAEHLRLVEVVERYQEAVALPTAPELDSRPTDLYRGLRDS